MGVAGSPVSGKFLAEYTCRSPFLVVLFAYKQFITVAFLLPSLSPTFILLKYAYACMHAHTQAHDTCIYISIYKVLAYMLNETKQLAMIEVNQLKCVIDKTLASLLNRIKVMFSLSLMCVLGGGAPIYFLAQFSHRELNPH